MKKRKFDVLILLIYSVPYVFLGMLGDYLWHSLWLYGLMVAAMVGLLIWCIRSKRKIVLILGNALTFLTSCFFTQYVANEAWDYYFKIIPTIARTVQFSCIVLVIQLVILWIVRSVREEKAKEKDAS